MHSRLAIAATALLVLTGGAACESAADQTRAADREFISPADCPVTVPSTPFVPNDPYLAAPPDYYQAVWFGTGDLWTMLSPEGETWEADGLPWNGRGFGQKTWWLSKNFNIRAESEPAISVTGRRLDADGSFTAGNPGTHGFTDFGDAMLVGIDMPSTGCWELRAEYKGADLAVVVLVK